MAHIVYLITREDGLQYVGSTTENRFDKRINEHKYHPRFNKFDFSVEVLKDNILTEVDRFRLEKEYIKSFDTYKNGLNETPDGTGRSRSTKFTTLGYNHTEKTKRKISQKLSGKPAWNKGKTGYFSKETLENMSKKRKGVRTYQKLTTSLVRDIRAKFQKFKYTPTVQRNGRVLSKESAFSKNEAKEYNVSETCIRHIVTNKTWKDVL